MPCGAGEVEMSKYTKGPWKVAGNGYDVVPAGIREDATAVIARVFGSYNPAIVGAPFDVRELPQDGNAALIAAAPDLLDTCRNVLDSLYHAEGDVIEDLRSELRKVIALAEGRSEVEAEEAEYIRRERAGLCVTCGVNKAGFKSFASGNFQGECEPCFRARRSA